MRIHRPEEFFARIGRDGLIGFGEAYLTGAWDADDLGRRSSPCWPPSCRPWSRPPLQRLRAVVRRPAAARTSEHRRTNTRDNIAHHYDLSNDLFEMFLDETLSYSSALFDADAAGSPTTAGRPPGRPATEAQVRKIERLLDAAGVGEGTRVLEIGTGWGELAIRAARRGADRPHGDALDRAARAGPRADRARPGVADRVDVELLRLPRPSDGRVRRRGVGRDDRGGRPRVLADVLRDHRPGARAGRPGRHPGDHDAARPDARDPGRLHVDQQVHLPRRLPARRSR